MRWRPRLPPIALLVVAMTSLQGCATHESRIEPSNAPVVHRDAQSADPRSIDGRGDRASNVVITAMNFLGNPYRYGGSSVGQGFDCSGFTRHVFNLSLGIALPRSADEQAMAGGMVDVDRAELRPGDLVFFNTLKRTFSHVGIYVGEGRFIHSPRSGSEVRIENMRYAYWAQRFTGARRATDLSTVGEATLNDTAR